MKILIAGASGFIGKNLVSSFNRYEHEITVLGRDINRLKKFFLRHRILDWQGLEVESASDYQLVINLCGENISSKRWTSDQKTKILQSRLETTSKLSNWALTSSTLQSLRFLNASAVGIYGLNTRQNTERTLIKNQKNCFSQQIVREWEAIVKKKLENKISYTLMRFGVVLKKKQGILKKLEIPYKFGLASIFGNGEQQISWVHIKDLVRAINFIIKNQELSGPVNIVAPGIVTQKQLARNLAKTLNRPCFLKMPNFLIKLLFGQMGQELLLSGQEVISKRLKESRFYFKHPNLEEAISHEYQNY